MTSPVIVGSILLNADELVGKLVKSRLPVMQGADWGPYVALGVIRRGRLVGGVVYHNYRGFDVQMSGAFEKVNWALPGTLRALASYPFETLNCRRVTMIVGRRNKTARKLVERLGFAYEGLAKKGYDGNQDAILYGMLKEHCRWIHEKPITTAAAA